jgi:hypothetical protein
LRLLRPREGLVVVSIVIEAAIYNVSGSRATGSDVD